MLTFIVRRVLAAIPVLLIASFFLFCAVRVTVDPAARLRASRDPHAYVNERHRLHLDEPLTSQYWRWLKGVAHGDWGKSDLGGQSIRPAIQKAMWNTFQLIFWGVLVAMFVAIAIGVFSAIRQYSALDYTFSGMSYVGLALPPFVFGLLAIAVLGVGVQQWFGVKPFGYLGLHHGDNTGFNLEYISYLILPVATLTVQIIAEWSRYMRASMLDAMSSDYIRTARAKGVPEHKVVLRHALRNSLIPLVSVAALEIGLLFGGLVITENIFSIHGMGYMFVNAFSRGDATLLSAWVVVVAAFVIVFNLMADLLYGVLDPRVRLT